MSECCLVAGNMALPMGPDDVGSKDEDVLRRGGGAGGQQANLGAQKCILAAIFLASLLNGRKSEKWLSLRRPGLRPCKPYFAETLAALEFMCSSGSSIPACTRLGAGLQEGTRQGLGSEVHRRERRRKSRQCTQYAACKLHCTAWGTKHSPSTRLVTATAASGNGLHQDAECWSISGCWWSPNAGPLPANET